MNSILFFSLILMLLTNLLLAFSFVIGKYFIFKKENKVHLVSYYSIFIVVLFAIYMLTLAICGLSSLFIKHAQYGILLLVFIFFPFIIGIMSKYEKINFYTNIQILTLIFSFCAGLSMFYKLFLI